MNLVQNALDAVRERGSEGDVRVTVAGGGGQAIVTVSDNGPGLSPEIASRLFEPYATTKPHGTGLGLAIAQRIAIEHTGELSYVAPAEPAERAERKEPHGGATFRLVLPVDGPRPAAVGGGSA